MKAHARFLQTNKKTKPQQKMGEDLNKRHRKTAAMYEGAPGGGNCTATKSKLGLWEAEAVAGLEPMA